MAETPGLTSSNFAAVTTGAEVQSNGTSLQFSDFVDAFNTRWRDAALAARDAKGRKTEAVVAVVAVVDNFDLSGLRKPRCALNLHFPEMMLINKTMIMKMMTRSITKNDAEWHAGDDDDKPEETAHTGLPKDGPELLDQSDGNLADADASTSQMYVSASRSFQEARELLSRVKIARGYLLSCCCWHWRF